MSDQELDQNLQEFLEVRKPGAHLDDARRRDDFVLALGVDLTNYKKFPRVDDRVTYTKDGLDIRQRDRSRLRAPTSPTTAGRSGPTCASPTSRTEALVRMSRFRATSTTCCCVEGGRPRSPARYGDDAMAGARSASAWTDRVVPELDRIEERVPARAHGRRRPDRR